MSEIKSKKDLFLEKGEPMPLASVLYPQNLEYGDLPNFYQGLEEIAKQQSISFILYDIRWPKNHPPQP